MPNEFPPVKPYVPALTTEPSFRIAHALEFIAAPTGANQRQDGSISGQSRHEQYQRNGPSAGQGWGRTLEVPGSDVRDSLQCGLAILRSHQILF
jgi:hypothetical protein